MIRFFVTDVDGTLTDGKIYIGATGEMMKAFCVKDGHALYHMLPSASITPVIITGRESEIVKVRAEELRIQHVHQGVKDKLDFLKSFLADQSATLAETAYFGDDVNDLDCIAACGVSGCPHDAIKAVKDKVNYICTRSAGNGAAREFIEWLFDNWRKSEEI